jgi:hypothetical protein
MPALANDLARLIGPLHGSELRSQISPDLPTKQGAFAAPRRLAAYMGAPPRSQCNPGKAAHLTPFLAGTGPYQRALPYIKTT